MTRPRYQEVSAAKIPQGKSADGFATVNGIAGEALGAKAIIDALTPIVFLDWSLFPGADVVTAVSREQQALVYVFKGSALVGNAGQRI